VYACGSVKLPRLAYHPLFCFRA